MELIFVALFFGCCLVWYLMRNRYDQLMELDPTVTRLKQLLMPTFPELAQIRVMKGTSSYTVNKEKIYLCTTAAGVEYDDNMLTYVLLHELAHVLTLEFGHGAEFIENFKLLLERARQAGHYDPTLSKVENYCA